MSKDKSLANPSTATSEFERRKLAMDIVRKIEGLPDYTDAGMEEDFRSNIDAVEYALNLNLKIPTISSGHESELKRKLKYLIEALSELANDRQNDPFLRLWAKTLLNEVEGPAKGPR